METIKFIYRYFVFILIVVGLASCSSTNNLPADDVYYSSKAQNPTQYNWDDFQKNAQNQSENNVDKGKYVGEYDSDYSTDVGSGVVAGNAVDTTEYEFIDEYYDSDYASRINRFNDNGSSDDYYDESYTNSGYSSPNISLSFGMGMGYGWGMGFNYGWPYYGGGYPYYGWGYPYYSWGYPYYGSYWAGYNNGYWNGYRDGYYNGGGGYYPGGYYPEYGYTAAYSPRGRGAGGSSIPRYGSGRSGSISKSGAKMLSDDKNLLARSGNFVSATSSAVNAKSTLRSGDNSGTIKPKSRTESVTRRPNEVRKQSETNKLRKPGQELLSDPSKSAIRQKQASKRSVQQRKTRRYQKPKSYQSLPSRQPRTSKEYVRQAKPGSAKKSNRSANTFKRSLKQNNSRSNYSAPGTKSSSRNNTVKTRTNSTPKSYRAPTTRSNSSRSYSKPSRSYSSPTKSSSSGGGSRSSSSGGRSSSSRSSGGRR